MLRASEEQLTIAAITRRRKARLGHGLQRTTVSEALNDLSERHLADGEG